MKENILKMKEDIKEYVRYQKSPLSHSEFQWSIENPVRWVDTNFMRRMYIAYGLIKGKDMEYMKQVYGGRRVTDENGNFRENDLLAVEKIVAKYEAICDSKEGLTNTTV